ncbi:MAG: hypothetical protein ACXADA_17010 [Candidatus Hodarchaeales archaeon]
MSESKEQIQCPCGQVIIDSSEYQLLFLKKEMNEIDISCPNEYCYLRELGFITFKWEKGDIVLDKGRFYAPFVTWNATKMSEEQTIKKLKKHLVDICEKHVQWDRIKPIADRKEI